MLLVLFSMCTWQAKMLPNFFQSSDNPRRIEKNSLYINPSTKTIDRLTKTINRNYKPINEFNHTLINRNHKPINFKAK